MAQYTPVPIVLLLDTIQWLTEFYDSVPRAQSPNISQSAAALITVRNLTNQMLVQLDRARFPVKDYGTRITTANDRLVKAIHRAYKTTEDGTVTEDFTAFM
jgi:hypothetical protein